MSAGALFIEHFSFHLFFERCCVYVKNNIKVYHHVAENKIHLSKKQNDLTEHQQWRKWEKVVPFSHK